MILLLFLPFSFSLSSSLFLYPPSFAHLPSPMLLHRITTSSNSTIHRSLPSNSHTYTSHTTTHTPHAHCDSYTTRTRDCEHQQNRHCRPNLLRLFSLEPQRKRPPLKATSGCSVELFCASCAPTSFVEGLFN